MKQICRYIIALLLFLLPIVAHAQEERRNRESVTLKPTTITKKTSIRLPGPVSDVEVGAGGRLLVLHLKNLQQLAVFDVTTAKVIQYVPLESNDIVYAAGARELFVGYRAERMIERWDFISQKKEVSVPAPVGGIGDMAMGAQATAPLFVLGSTDAKKSWLVDPRTMKPSLMRWKGWEGGAWGPVYVNVSFDGSTVAVCGGGWAGIEVASIGHREVNTTATGSYARDEVLISGNGALVFSNKAIVRRDLASEVDSIEGNAFPAISSDYSVTVWQHNRKHFLSVFSNGDPRRLITLKDIPEIGQKSKLPNHKRIMLIPKGKVLVTISPGSDTLILRPFDLAQQLADEGIDYLFVDSEPVTEARAGSTYRYEITVKSRRGGVKTELQSGPSGMRLSENGTLTWKVPGRNADDSYPVIIDISDDSQQHIFHTFRIAVK